MGAEHPIAPPTLVYVLDKIKSDFAPPECEGEKLVILIKDLNRLNVILFLIPSSFIKFVYDNGTNYLLILIFSRFS